MSVCYKLCIHTNLRVSTHSMAQIPVAQIATPLTEVLTHNVGPASTVTVTVAQQIHDIVDKGMRPFKVCSAILTSCFIATIGAIMTWLIVITVQEPST
jgi:hypothetical protein